MEDGLVFDTNIESVAIENDLHEEGDEYGPFTFQLSNPGQQSANNAIAGWQYAFRHLRSGAKAVLVVPSPLAYQDQERGKIPANSILVFNVEFLGMD